VETGVSLESLGEASKFIGSRIERRLPSRYAQAIAAGSSNPDPQPPASSL
jgi:hypothetical protein